jgi:hypothetical protein
MSELGVTGAQGRILFPIASGKCKNPHV